MGHAAFLQVILIVLLLEPAYTPTQMAEKPPPAPEMMQRLTDSDLKWLAMRRYRRKNTIVGLSILAGVLGVYTYSMWAVKQEDFLDEDFNTPGPSSSSSRTSSSGNGS